MTGMASRGATSHNGASVLHVRAPLVTCDTGSRSSVHFSQSRRYTFHQRAVQTIIPQGSFEAAIKCLWVHPQPAKQDSSCVRLSLPSPLVCVLKVVSWTLCRIYNAWLQVGDVFILACWINTAGCGGRGGGVGGIWDVEGCGSPAEQPLSAAASPAAEVKPGNQCLREPWIFFAFTAHEVLFHQGRSCTERQRERAHLRHTSHCARKKIK